MASQSSAPANLTISLSQKVSNIMSSGQQDYSSWRSLISEIGTTCPEDINTISLAYDTFLSRFPLCHWHLEKYAYQKAKLSNSQEAANIFEQAVEVAMYSVGFWAEYFTFAAACFESPVDVRRLFERAISFVGKDYCCHVLWDKYMKYEFNQDGWVFLAQSYIWALRFPTKKLQFYYDNFKQFIENLEEEIGYAKNDNIVEQLSAPCAAIELSKDEISLVIKDMLDSSDRPLKSKALDRYRSIGEEFYLEARQMDEKVKRFETKIQRRYFDVTPLDDNQLTNWHLYLDFIEKQDNLDSTMKLYERCLIPCANYPEFWMRYVEFLESKGGRELAISALGRGTQIFLKSVPEIHLFDARFKEHIGDTDGARAALALCFPKTDSIFIESIAAQANLERRLGNLTAASATYEKALKKARDKQKLHLLPTLYSHFARLTFLITCSAAASRDVLIEGIKQVPHCGFLLEELLNFAMTNEGASHLNIINSIIGDAISPRSDENEGLDAKDRENISCLFLEFINLCGTMQDIREAWNRHVKLFPQSLRMKTPSSKHPASGSYSIGLARDKKVKYDHPVLSQPSTNHSDQLYGQERVPHSPMSNKVHPNQSSNNVNEKLQMLSTEKVLRNGDDSRDSEPAKEISCQSKEGRKGPMVVSAEFSDHAKDNASTEHDSDQSRGDYPRPIDVCAELGIQSREDASIPPKSALEVGKSTGTTESIEECQSSIPNVQPKLDNGFNQPMHSVSLEHTSLESQGKESCELIPMSCDESERGGSVSHQHNTPMEAHYSEEPLSTREDSIGVDNAVPAPGHVASRFHDREQSPYVDHHPANELNSKAVMNQNSSQQYPDRQQQSQLKDKATCQDQQTGIPTPPVSSQPVSYAQENTNPTTPTTSQQEWQAQQSLAMNHMMLQYHYQQQQLLQQQYQQQLQGQHPYYQYMNQQQPYQLQPQQQQYVEHQQHYQQAHDPRVNSQQQVHDKEHQQPQDHAYQAHQLAYQQQATQEQQLLWQQQYQQYQSYQFMQQQQQQQLKEGSTPSKTQGHNMHLHPSQRQQDDQLLQYHQAHSQQQFTQHMGQNQQGSKSGTPDHAAARPYKSPPCGARSPQSSQ